MREYNYNFDLNDVELPKSIKEKYKRIKYSIENNQYYMKLLNEICEKEDKHFDAYNYPTFIEELLKILIEI